MGKYFFLDIIGWIKTYDPRTGKVVGFARNLPPVPDALAVDPSGNLYVLTQGHGASTGNLLRISFRRP